jgi:L-seryl-tRNA(Ser) seleniumtransferase
MSPSPRQELLSKIPGVDEVLSWPEVEGLIRKVPRRVVVDAIRDALERIRGRLLQQEGSPPLDESLFSPAVLFPLIQEGLNRQIRPRLERVINATGVVIHTNLGRSPLHPSALRHLIDISRAYSNLEYDLERGERGNRYACVEEILCRLTGAESALVVNNNAGAVLLTLNALAEEREVIVSRGELVEIGGAFRIPDVMKRSGALLKEVGTTNRTHLTDYQKAIGPQTALLLKVHTSNFRIMGFTSDVSTQDLVRLGKEHRLPVMEDLGSGCLIDLTKYGLAREPAVPEVMKTGVDVVTFSGDKLLGGPQAGIILGTKRVLDLVKTSPLTRALRIDKLTLAALESTLLLYLDEKKAVEEIPTLRMLTIDQNRLRQRGRRLLKKLKGIEGITVVLREDVSQVGGGSLPLQELPTIVVAVKPLSLTVNDLERDLRRNSPPIVSRISKDEVILDLRTIFDEEIPPVALGIKKALLPQGRT